MEQKRKWKDCVCVVWGEGVMWGKISERCKDVVKCSMEE